ncbi:MAG: hypothetical protein ISR59_08360 [Anaerolineales bacterium]|uniref:HNH endonuclease n=1 Tax=Candidatus Desulfolinea nitratireducens TaxID=2841698 RepID=A0A8J6NI30_9CHLR|nr:hypothetical protein [Candidatus Desulfolinea nitratireducens]MBL6961110.1 hypothetical protein [Anaerolineales bacterium]
MRISEADLILPALFVISENPGITTSILLQKLNQILKPTGEDAEILSGRSDTKFSQIVRNIRSHKTLENMEYVTYSSGESRRTGGNFNITAKGQVFLDNNQEIVDNLLLHGFPYDSVVGTIQKIAEAKTKGKQIKIVDENLVIREGRQRQRKSIAYERSDDVRKAAVDYYRLENGQIVCDICGFNFLDVYGERGRDYIEIHHEKPLSETEGEKRIAFLKEAVQSVKPVCANCHKMIHRKRDDMLSIADMKLLISNQKSE